MKTKHILAFALFITLAVLWSGCGKTDTNLASENASLKARLQKLEQQLKEANSRVGSPVPPPAPTTDLQGQLDEAQKKAEAATTELNSVRSQLEAQKANIDKLMQDASSCQQAREKAEKDLELYRDKAASALKQFKILRSTLGGETATLDNFHQNYLAMQMAVARQVDALPESKVRREILGVLETFTHMNETWETASLQMAARTRQAQAYFDQFTYAGGLGPIPHTINLGKTRLLAPAEKENAATAASRDQQIVSLETDLDLGIKNLQALVNRPGA
jgi:hypothetical protein